jgi:hypothetical protein
MAHHAEHRHHPIRILHVLVCLAMTGWFSWFAWENHPSRVAFRTQYTRHARRAPRPRALDLNLPEKLQVRLALVRSVLPDAIGGLAVLALFTLGTGVYARRFEVWLEAHRAGEAAALRGLGLDRAALGANRDRKKGATL